MNTSCPHPRHRLMLGTESGGSSAEWFSRKCLTGKAGNARQYKTRVGKNSLTSKNVVEIRLNWVRGGCSILLRHYACQNVDVVDVAVFWVVFEISRKTPVSPIFVVLHNIIMR